VELDTFEAHRKTLTHELGTLSYLDVGEGPVVMFVHGVFMNCFLWRKAITALSADRRCIAVDLPAHGHSLACDEQDLSLIGGTDLLAALCEDLGIDAIDLVGNDTGGAMCQIFAVRHGELLRTLTLTNCDAHDNLPPAAFALGKRLAEENQLAPLVMELGKSTELARGNPGLAMGFTRPRDLSDEIVNAYMGTFADPERARQLERFVNSTKVEDLLAVEPGLEQLQKPTLIAWGTSDVFFEIDWAHWLKDHIPGAREIVEIDGGGLFFPDEDAERFVPHLRRFLDEHSPVASA
jgi:pimeloyl-ACP methyl ester carboxylesterase